MRVRVSWPRSPNSSLEHEFDNVLLAEDGCRRFDPREEKQATFMSGELLIPQAAANGAAFDGKTNEQVAIAFGVSEQFARMQLSGPRKMANERLRSRQLAVVGADGSSPIAPLDSDVGRVSWLA
jgi:Zn-dependent peptidase ImmA (M78 family)